MRKELDYGELATTSTPPRERAALFVLVADENRPFRAALVGALRVRGCLVVEACDGAQLLEKLALALDGESSWPEVVVLNLHLRYLSGLNLLSVLWELPEHPATLLVTRLEDHTIDSAAARFGAARVFHEPIVLDELVEAVMASARSKQAARSAQLAGPS